MKKIILCLVLITLNGCLSMFIKQPEATLEIKNDEFKGIKTVTLEANLYSQETHRLMGSDIPVFAAKCIFYKEIKNNNVTAPKVTFNVQVDINREPLKGDVIFLIDDNKLNYKIEEISAENISKVYGSNSKVSSSNYKILRGSIKLNDSFEQSISTSNPIKIRLYSGEKPMTFSIENNDLKKLSEFLAAK